MLIQDTVFTQAEILLALVGTIFLPLTFMTGVFGMNFVRPDDEGVDRPSIPLLRNKHGYDMFWMFGTGFVLLLLLFFHMAGFTRGAGMSGKSVCATAFVITALVAALIEFDGV
jgi:hypothetical protein